MMKEDKLLVHIVPELLEGEGMEQNKHHIYKVLEHNLRSLDYAAREGFSEDVRIAALFHDIGKARTKAGEGDGASFHSHEVVGTDMAYKLLNRLRFPKNKIVHITKLVRYHMYNYQYDPEHPEEETTDSAIRRIIANIGKENINELIDLRLADRMGSGCKKAESMRVRRFRARVEKLLSDPTSYEDLKINGDDVMNILGIKPGKRIGYFKNILLDEILQNPDANTREHQEGKIKELHALSDPELAALSAEALARIQDIATEEDKKLEEKYKIKDFAK